jgi:hypothetical protein
MTTAIAEKLTPKGQPTKTRPPQALKGLGKYQRFILEVLAESPTFTNDLWKRCQRKGLARAAKNGVEDKNLSYSYPPFRLHIAKSLKSLKRRGLVRDRVLPGSTAYDSPINRHWWYLAGEESTELQQRLETLNTVANANGWLQQLYHHALEKPFIVRSSSLLGVARKGL